MARTAILYIAQNCNQQCVFCLEEDGAWNEFVDPTTVEVTKEIKRLYDRNARHITFMGGETFFRKDLPRIIADAKALGYTRVGVTTNGTVLSKQGFIQRLVDAGLDFIELSIHGHTRELSNSISRAEVTFDRQARALAEIEAAGLFTIVNVVVCRENKDHLVDVARYVHEGFPKLKARFKFKFVSLQGWEAERAATEKPLGYDDVDFVAVGDYLDEQGAAFWFYNVPLCRLGRHAHHSHEVATLAVDEVYFDLDHRGQEGYYDSGAQFEGRVWPSEPCGDCSLRALCPGLEESHRLARGSSAINACATDPIPLLESALRGRGADPASAAARLAVLVAQPRPERFIRQRPEGALRFHHAMELEPLDVTLAERKPDQRAFYQTSRFSLSYRSWDGLDPHTRPNVQSLLGRACAALDAADARGASIDDARQALAKLAEPGWTLDNSSDLVARRQKTVEPPLLRDLRPPGRRVDAG